MEAISPYARLVSLAVVLTACSGVAQQASEGGDPLASGSVSATPPPMEAASSQGTGVTPGVMGSALPPATPPAVAPVAMSPMPDPGVGAEPSMMAELEPEMAPDPVSPTDPVLPEPAPDMMAEPTPASPEPETMAEPVPEPVPEPIPEPVPEPESVAGVCQDLGGYDNGSVTFYRFDQGTVIPNCSYEITNRNPDTVAHIATGGGQYFGAINTQDYATAAMCGACVELTRDGSRKVTVTIVDQCPVATNPKCRAGHIDLSQAAFQQLGDVSEGYLGTGNGGMYGSISWKYVPCPIEENVSFRLKEPDRTDWNELLVQGHTHPITSVEINGQQATRKEYNYWEPPNGDMGSDPFKIKVTDVNGGVLNVEVARSNGDMMSTAQLTCQ